MAEEHNSNTGLDFNQRYLDRNLPERDSMHFRRRVGGFFDSEYFDYRNELAAYLLREVGEAVPWVVSSYSFRKYFETIPLDRALVAITKTWRFLSAKDVVLSFRRSKSNATMIAKSLGVETASALPTAPERFIQTISRIFEEENLDYSIDDRGGVSYRVDAEFVRNSESALDALSAPGLIGAATEFEKALKDLRAFPPETKNAIKSAFDSLEYTVKRLYGVDKLNRNVVIQRVRADAVASAGDHDSIREFYEKKFVMQFGNWVNDLHDFRHAQLTQAEIREPPFALAVAIVAQTAIYLRWLCSVHGGAR